MDLNEEEKEEEHSMDLNEEEKEENFMDSNEDEKENSMDLE